MSTNNWAALLKIFFDIYNLNCRIQLSLSLVSTTHHAANLSPGLERPNTGSSQ